MWLNSKRFKMPFAELFSDLIKRAMLHPVGKNYTGSPFHTVSCSNIILLHSRLSNSPLSNPVALLMEIGSLFLQFVPGRPLVGKVLQWLLPLNRTDSHTIGLITEQNNRVLKPVKSYLFRLAYPPP